MTAIIRIPEKNLWESICKESEKKKDPAKDGCQIKYINYDPSIHHAVFFGCLHIMPEVYENPAVDFDPAISHPACIGYCLIDIPEQQTKPSPPLAPDKKTSIPREYLEHYVFPILEPALTEMLKQAKIEKCFERKKTKFNACDYITEYLYRNNKTFKNRDNVKLKDIPFVKEWLKEHPRPPLPKSLLWTEDEAAVVVQSFWRGYLVRRLNEIQELRQWQREWRQENQGIHAQVTDFWKKKMPDWQQVTPSSSTENQLVSQS